MSGRRIPLVGTATNVAVLVAVMGGDAGGQVVLDGKFGQSGALPGPNFEVTAEMGATRGNNLFHSFSQFSLKSGETAHFSGPAALQNILARVTGGTASTIDGTIRSSVSGANLFLINPAGVIFGPAASLDVGGSFAASSADYLKLADGARFVASLDADDSALSTAPVGAFGFLGSAPGGVALEGAKLRVPEATTVSLVGGEVSITGGTVTAPGGEIQVVGVKSAGEVAMDSSGGGLAGFREQFPQSASVELTGRAQLNTTGTGGGRIVIRGGSLRVEDSTLQANSRGATEGRGIDVAVTGDLELIQGGQITSLTPAGQGLGGAIRIEAGGAVRLEGGGLVDELFNPKTQISTATGDPRTGGGRARGGDIAIQAERVELNNSAQISSASYGLGDAGRIEIAAAAVSLDARLTTPTQITANTQRIRGGGRAGDIVVRTESLEMRNGATILAASFGAGGAGAIDIEAGKVALLSGSIITAGTFGSGKGGNIRMEAGTMQIDGTDALGGGPDLLTGIQAVTTSPESPAPGGNIGITAGAIELDHKGSVFTTSYGRGQGGNIDIAAGSLTLGNRSTIRAAGEAAGPAGRLAIRAERDVVLGGASAISTSAPDSSGGNIEVRAGSEVRVVESEVNARAGLDGGNISVAGLELVYLLRGTLTGQADATGSGFGNGGNLTIEPSRFLILNESALISKSSFGNGGNIDILTDYFFPSESLIDASAPFGLPGTVVVTAPEVNLSGSLVGLPGGLLDAESLLRPDCSVRLSGNVSSFIVLGRGGLPLQPGGFLPSSLLPDREERKVDAPR